jgi:LuxR family maltose regulon positive regulatory protein
MIGCGMLSRMETPLLQTKLYIPPVRPNLVPRLRLVERLNEGLLGQSGGFDRELTLLSAPGRFWQDHTAE